MPITCFEGPSAVGKSTTAKAFKESRDAFVVPEVQELYVRPADEPADWYFQRQAERWSMAEEQRGYHQLVILDGDPFQPLWYNWAYNFAGWQGLDFMERFYRTRIEDGTIRFPDLYFIFGANEAELRKRKEGDAGRRRRGFEHHLKMIEPQRRYFRAMQAHDPRRVIFLEAETTAASMRFIQQHLFSASAQADAAEPGELFDRMIDWMRANST